MQIFAQGRQIVFEELAGKVVNRVEIEQETNQIAFHVHCEDGTSLELTFSTVVVLNYAGIGFGREGEDVTHNTLYTADEPSLVDSPQPGPPGVSPSISKGKVVPFGIR